MELKDFDILDPIKETGWAGHEEWNIDYLYEVNGEFYIVHSSHCVFFTETLETVRHISEEEAVAFLEEPNVEYDF